MLMELTTDSIDDVLSDKQVVVVDFWAEWCGPCKAMLPVLEDMSEKYDGAVSVGKVDINSNMDLVKKYNISSVPCLIVFKNGKEVHRSIGFKGKESVHELFSKYS